MIKYIIIQLSDNAVSYCHYAATATAEPRTIPIEMLHKGITWAMKENATVQFVYPAHRLPDEYHAIIESIDHAKIVPARCDDEQLENAADVVVFDNYADMEGYNFRSTAAYVLRTTRDELFKNHQAITGTLGSVQRFNVVITDIDSFTDNDLATYARILDSLADKVTEQYAAGNAVQFNLLTDRIMLDSMNNCNAGWETIALAPDGRFYPCPAFYTRITAWATSTAGYISRTRSSTASTTPPSAAVAMPGNAAAARGSTAASRSMSIPPAASNASLPTPSATPRAACLPG